MLYFSTTVRLQLCNNITREPTKRKLIAVFVIEGKSGYRQSLRAAQRQTLSSQSLSSSRYCCTLIRAVKCEASIVSHKGNPLRLDCSTRGGTVWKEVCAHRCFQQPPCRRGLVFLPSFQSGAIRGGSSEPAPPPPARAASPPREGCDSETYLSELGNLLAHFHVHFPIASLCRAAASGFRSIASPRLMNLVYARGHKAWNILIESVYAPGSAILLLLLASPGALHAFKPP